MSKSCSVLLQAKTDFEPLQAQYDSRNSSNRERRELLEANEAEIISLTATTSRAVTEVEQSFTRLRIADPSEEEEQTEESTVEEDKASAEKALMEELDTIHALHIIIRELQVKLEDISAAQQRPSGQISIIFGDLGSGSQTGQNYGTLNNNFNKQ
jgi:type I site-specific restriction endonuclease